jgi:ankyrin repeat protein
MFDGSNFFTKVKTALYMAIAKGNTEEAKLLIDKGNNLDLVDNESFFLAIQKGHTRVVKMLLDKGTNVDLQNQVRCG